MRMHATMMRAALVGAVLSAAPSPVGAIDPATIATAPLPTPPPNPPPGPATEAARPFAAGAAAMRDPAAATGDDVLRLGQDGHDRMTVSVEITNEAGLHSPFAFLVDTGAERTIVARTVTTALGLVPNGRGRLVGVAGLRDVDMVTLASLALGRRDLYDLVSPVLDADAIGADGIIGLDGLQGQRIVLDFDRNRLLLGDARTLGGDRGYDIVVQARRKSGQLILTDALVDGVRTAIVIDTGSDTSIGNRALARALARNHARETVQLLSVTGQQTTADVGMARALTLGGMTLLNTQIAFTDAPAFDRLGLRRRPGLLLGMAQLRLFHRVAIDFAARRILFAGPGPAPT